MLIKYNSKSEEYKKPFGAVSTNCNVSFSIHVSKALNPDSAAFIIRQDNRDTSLYISMQKSGEYDSYIIFSCTYKTDTPDLYFYRFEINTPDGIRFVGLKDGEAKIEDWLPEWQLTVYSSDFNTPEWAKGGIMYQIFPDRFAKSENFKPLKAKNTRKIHKNWYDIPDFIYNNPDYKANDYFGGNIDGIIEKLDYIKSLGINIIYLNPVFESPEYHRYSTANYMNIDPYFGTNDKLKELCEKCNFLNIKIILDGVFSHTGADSIYFNKYGHYDSVGAFNSPDSLYYNWYSFFKYPEKYECWWNFENLPNVNETNPEYMNYITGNNGVIEYWQNLGVSGWRLDVADELPDEFLDTLYKKSKSLNKDSFIIGEVWEDATNKFAYGKRRRYLLGGQMDSVMNYPWRTAILEFVKNGDEKLLNDRLISILENYPPHIINCLMNSISTHDTLRAMTYFGVNHEVPDESKGKYVMTKEEYEKGKLMLFNATFLQFTLPGIPCIYYGDEVGLYGFKDPYCRMTYPYGKEDYEILDFYKSISRIRNKYKEEFIKPMKLYNMKNGLYSFKRGKLICAINCGNENQCFDISDINIVFEYGKNIITDHSFELYPSSMIILEVF